MRAARSALVNGRPEAGLGFAGGVIGALADFELLEASLEDFVIAAPFCARTRY